jgi:hypothetical protein
MTTSTSKTVSVYYDKNSDPTNPGWVARLVRRGEYGTDAIEDSQIGATDELSARREAAELHGVEIDEVNVITE